VRAVELAVSAETFAALEELVFETDEPERWNLREDLAAGQRWVQGVFESEATAEAGWRQLAALAGIESEPTYRTIRDQDWKESYKAHFRPWRAGTLHWAPVWLRGEYKLPGGHEVLWLDPGMAFGTGNHATTRLCVERLLAFRAARGAAPGLRVVDAGCGSGILALSAAKLGYLGVTGFDNDAEAVRIARENAALNGLEEGRVAFAEGDLARGLRPVQADCLMANILAPVLEELANAARLVAALRPGGWLVLSGILAEEAERTRSVYASLAAWESVRLDVREEWSGLTLVAAGN